MAWGIPISFIRTPYKHSSYLGMLIVVLVVCRVHTLLTLHNSFGSIDPRRNVMMDGPVHNSRCFVGTSWTLIHSWISAFNTMHGHLAWAYHYDGPRRTSFSLNCILGRKITCECWTNRHSGTLQSTKHYFLRVLSKTLS